MEAASKPDLRRGPGRPSSGAQERLLEAGLETLLEEGYAGLTYAKVADRAGENKSLISYYYGSKQGLVRAVAEVVGQQITVDVLEEIQGRESVEAIAGGLVAGLWKVMDEDPRLTRLYFDLSAVSVVDDEIRMALRGMKAAWREVVGGYVAEAGVPEEQVEVVAQYLLAGVEGLAIERLGTDDPELIEAASALFIRAAGLVVS